MNRLPLALFLSALVLILYSLVFAPKREPGEAELGPDSVSAPVEGGSAEGAPTTPAPGVPGVPGDGDPGDGAPGAARVAEAVIEPALKPEAETEATGPQETREEETLELEVGYPGEPGCYQAVFTNRGGALLGLRIGNFYDHVELEEVEHEEREHWTRLVDSAETGAGTSSSLVLRTSASSEPLVQGPLAGALWEMREIENGVEFELAQSTGVRFLKRVRFEPGSYELSVELEIRNESYATPGKATFFFTPAEVVPPESDERFYVEPQAVAAGRSAKEAARGNLGLPVVKTIPKRGKPIQGTFEMPSEVMSFAGVHNKYFAFLMRGADPQGALTIRGAEWRSVYDGKWAEENPTKADQAWRLMATDVLLELTVPPIGGTSIASYKIYAGPKERDAITSAFPDYEGLLRADVDAWLPGVESVATFLIGVLRFLAGLTGNWGMAIILMTVLIRATLFPLNRRSQTSMARYQALMKRMQPKIDELKKKHEGDLDKQRKAQAELMQKEGAMPPLGGCLPIFVQLPVFFGLFTAVRTSFDLRQQPFVGWITDLSKPDRLMRLDLHTGLPLIGDIEYLNILPPLMVALWVGQQMVMPKPADDQARQMQKMMMFMPLVMGFFLYNYAAGLSLYMITQSFLGIFEISVIKKLWPVDDTVQPKKKGGGFLSRLAEKQAEQMKRMEEMKRQQSATRSRGGGSRKRKKGR